MYKIVFDERSLQSVHFRLIISQHEQPPLVPLFHLPRAVNICVKVAVNDFNNDSKRKSTQVFIVNSCVHLS